MELWHWLNDNGSGIGAVAAVAAAVLAFWGIIKTTSDNRERAQPAMIVEFALAKDSDTTVDLVVRNAGATTARNVQVSFDPPLDFDMDAPQTTAQLIVERYKNSIPTISPGQEFTNIWWAGRAGPGGKLVNGEPTPEEITIDVEWDGIGRKRMKASYPLRVDTLTLTTYSVSSTSIKGRLKGIEAALKKLADKK